MKMTSSIWAAFGIPGDHVAYPFDDLHVAVRADPSLVIIRVGTNAGLRCVFHSPLYLGAAYAPAEIV